MSDIGSTLGRLCTELFGLRGPDPAELHAFAVERARHLSIRPAEYAARLRSDDEERALFTARATNGWTWFWREAESLLNACRVLESRGFGPRRAWVAGCSTGEEAFSLAIAAQLTKVDLHILATDIDRRRIEHARRGRYSASALRNLPASVRDAFLHQRGDEFVVDERVRGRVVFETHNLMQPMRGARARSFDLVSCRNVVLHAEGGPARRIVSVLRGALAPDGELILSAADQLTLGLPAPAAAPQAASPRALQTTTPSLSERPLPTPRVSPLRAAVRAFRDGAADEAERILGQWSERAPAVFEAPLALGNLLMALGRLEPANAHYDRAEAINPRDAELMMMRGILHRRQLRVALAERFLRRAVFFERDLWLAWLLLAGLHERHGRLPQASRALAAAQIAIGRRPILNFRAPAFGLADRQLDLATARTLCAARPAAPPPPLGERR